MSLQEEMKKYRAKHRLSQGALAEKCGLSTQTINSVENGNQTPSTLTEGKIRLVIEAEETKNVED